MQAFKDLFHFLSQFVASDQCAEPTLFQTYPLQFTTPRVLSKRPSAAFTVSLSLEKVSSVLSSNFLISIARDNLKHTRQRYFILSSGCI